MCTVNQIELLKRLADKEANPRFRDRLRALLLLSDGIDPETIARAFSINFKTIKYDWLMKWNNGGYDELIDSPRSGRPPKFTEDQKVKIQEYVSNKENRVTCPELVGYVKKKWGIDCDDETIRLLLHELGLSWQKPNKQNYKADLERQRNFLKVTR